MNIYKTKEFIRFARKEKLTDATLRDAVERAGKGLIDADLGRGLIKQRVARPGQGRRGGYRVLLAFRSTHRTVFVYGFAKNERSNIDPDELAHWQTVAEAYLKMPDTKLQMLVDANDVSEVTGDVEN